MSTGLLSLPEEILVELFLYLPYRSFLLTIPFVCTSFASVLRNNGVHIWRSICRRWLADETDEKALSILLAISPTTVPIWQRFFRSLRRKVLLLNLRLWALSSFCLHQTRLDSEDVTVAVEGLIRDEMGHTNLYRRDGEPNSAVLSFIRSQNRIYRTFLSFDLEYAVRGIGEAAEGNAEEFGRCLQGFGYVCDGIEFDLNEEVSFVDQIGWMMRMDVPPGVFPPEWRDLRWHEVVPRPESLVAAMRLLRHFAAVVVRGNPRVDGPGFSFGQVPISAPDHGLSRIDSRDSALYMLRSFLFRRKIFQSWVVDLRGLPFDDVGCIPRIGMAFSFRKSLLCLDCGSSSHSDSINAYVVDCVEFDPQTTLVACVFCDSRRCLSYCTIDDIIFPAGFLRQIPPLDLEPWTVHLEKSGTAVRVFAPRFAVLVVGDLLTVLEDETFVSPAIRQILSLRVGDYVAIVRRDVESFGLWHCGLFIGVLSRNQVLRIFHRIRTEGSCSKYFQDPQYPFPCLVAYLEEDDGLTTIPCNVLRQIAVTREMEDYRMIEQIENAHAQRILERELNEQMREMKNLSLQEEGKGDSIAEESDGELSLPSDDDFVFEGEEEGCLSEGEWGFDSEDEEL